MFRVTAEGVFSPADFLLVYSPAEVKFPWWTRFADRTLAHVDVWIPLEYDCFLVLQAQHDFLQASVTAEAPTGVVQKVHAQRLMGVAMFPLGVKTCVSVAKAVLGIRDIRVLTPRQLFTYVEKRKGVV